MALSNSSRGSSRFARKFSSAVAALATTAPKTSNESIIETLQSTALSSQRENESLGSSQVECRNLTKRYGVHVVVNNASIKLCRGSVHALVGANGAGKSTLIGMLSGRVEPDAGEVVARGKILRHGKPRASRAAGISVVYQEQSLVPQLSACANVFLGNTTTRFGCIATRQMEVGLSELCDRFRISIAPNDRCDTLTPSVLQLLEIMRALQVHAGTILLDEPTANLGEHERQQLYRVIRQMVAMDVAVLFVSHNLDEVFELSDTITVMREGNVIDTRPRSDWDRKSLIEGMLGERFHERLSDINLSDNLTQRRLPHQNNSPMLEARDIVVPKLIRVPHVAVGKGEVLGIAGLIGSGRTTLMRALAGLEPTSTGTIEIEGNGSALMQSSRAAFNSGIVLIPENRKEALIQHMSVAENLLLGYGLYSSTRAGIVTRRTLNRRALQILKNLNFQELFDRVDDPVGALSGGNQQKVLLAKWALRGKLLMVDEPTRGVDIGAKFEILEHLRELANSGASIIVASSEFEDLLAICDRITVLSAGEFVDTITKSEERWNVRDLLHMCFRFSDVEEVS